MKQALLRNFKPLWGEHGRGFFWLAAATAITYPLGLALQLLALRALSVEGYSTFVTALAVGGVAAALAAAVQPVVASRGESGYAAILPFGPGQTAALLAGASMLAVILLSFAVNPLEGALMVAQIPVHLVLVVGLGRLQARGSFGAIGLSALVISASRVTFAGAALLILGARDTAFVVALPAALLVALAATAAMDGFARPAVSGGARPRPGVPGAYLSWGLFALLLNGDAIYAKAFLSSGDAGRYAVALTLGRLSLYAAAPLSAVLLTSTFAGRTASHTQRLNAILLATGALLVVSVACLAIDPRAVVHLFSGEEGRSAESLLRGYAVLGPLMALATLEFTLLFGMRVPVPLWILMLLCLLAAGGAIVWNTAGALLLTQFSAVSLLAGWLWWLARRAPASAATGDRPIQHVQLS